MRILKQIGMFFGRNKLFMIKVSVIVPVYNAVRYLEKCIESIREQKLENIEIILVDDGSTDGSGEICDKIAKVDSRIKVLHLQNGGVCNARNKGIEVASGEYIGFIDSDDYIDKNMYSDMYEIIQKYNTEIVICDYCQVQEEKNISRTLDLAGGFYDKNAICKKIYPRLISDEKFNVCIFNSQCFTLSKRSLWLENNIRYDMKIKYAEDTIVAAKLFYNAHSFYYLKNKTYYYYRYHNDSRSRKYKKDAWSSYLELNSLFAEFFKDKEEIFWVQINNQIIYYALIAIREVKQSTMSDKEKINRVRRIMKDKSVREAFKKTHISFQIPFKRRVLLYLVKYRCAIIYYYITLRSNLM